ncbi:phloem protein 2-like protein [Tanacetum coccineum]
MYRFQKVVKISDTSNLNIQIQISSQFSSLGTIYGAYLVFKFCHAKTDSSEPYVKLKYRTSRTLNAYVAERRDNDWMMIELCRFRNHDQVIDFEVLLKSFSGRSCGSGPIYVDGIEFRPIDNDDREESVHRLINVDSSVNRDKQSASDFQEIMKRSDYDVLTMTEKELYELLITGVLIDNGEKLFLLSKVNYKKCHMLPPKAVINKSSDAKYFKCQSSATSRFEEVVELQRCQAFSIKCDIETQMLSQETAYACYLVFQLPDNCMGLKFPVKKRDLLIKNNKESTIIYLKTPGPVDLYRDKRVPENREDGWMEVIVWEFVYNNETKENYIPMELKLACLGGTLSGLTGFPDRAFENDIPGLGGGGGKKKKSNNNNSFGHRLDSSSTPLVDATGTIHMGTGSVNNLGNGGNGDGGSKKAGQTCPNSANDGGVACPPILTPNPGKLSSYANLIAISERFANTAYGFFLGKRVAYPVVANYVRNTWGKYGLVRSMFSSSTGLFSFQFSSIDGLDAFLENGPWFFRNNSFILKKWHPDENLLKEDVGTVLVSVKLHGVPVTAFSEDGLSAIATKLVTPLMLDSYTSDMCMQSWGREGFYTCNIRVEYEWKPPRYACCKVFGYFQEECPKNIGAGETKNLKKPSQTPRGFPVGPKVGFNPVKQVYQPVSKKPTANTSRNKKKNVVPNKEVSKSNQFDALNLVENDADLGTNGGFSNLASQEANSSGSSFWNASSSNSTTTPIIKKIDKIEKLIIDGKVNFVDDDGKPLEKIDSSGDYDSEDEVASEDNEMANYFLAKKDGYGINSLLEQWRESHGDDDYDYDLYYDDMYEGQEMNEKF